MHTPSQKARVLVTGASRGIGRAIAIELARAGFEIAINYQSNQHAAEETLSCILSEGGAATLLRFDVADRAACAKILGDEIKAHGSFYGIVSNAGITADAPFPALSGEAWDRVLRTNLDGFYNVTHPCVMPMIQSHRGGRIVTISSVAGILGNRGQVNYSASKAGLIGATKALSLELAKRKITVNCVAPGLIETEMAQNAPLEAIQKMIPMQRLGKPEEVASVVAFLFSPGAAYMTGQILAVNGGLQ